MQLSYCPPFIPHIARTLLSLPSTRFLHVSLANTSLYPACSPCSSLSYVHFLVLLFFLLGPGFWKAAKSANPGLKFYSAIAFYLEYLSSCCVVLTGSQSDSTTILDILCSHYFFVDERPRLKICLILESNQLNLTILRGTLPITPVYSHFPLHVVFSLIFSLYSTWISPVLLYIYPLPPCIVFVLPYIPVPFYIYPLLPCIVFVLLYNPLPF